MSGIDRYRRDSRDGTIEVLADSEAMLLERIASLEDDVEIYKTIACEAIARLHRHYEHQQRSRARLEALRDELRRYTAAATFAKAA